MAETAEPRPAPKRQRSDEDGMPSSEISGVFQDELFRRIPPEHLSGNKFLRVSALPAILRDFAVHAEVLVQNLPEEMVAVAKPSLEAMKAYVAALAPGAVRPSVDQKDELLRLRDQYRQISYATGMLAQTLDFVIKYDL